MKQAQIDQLSYAAQDGDRIVVDGTTMWAGMGNRSGLYDQVAISIGEKYRKSWPRTAKKLATVVGVLVEVKQFRNITRDRGRWVCLRSFVATE